MDRSLWGDREKLFTVALAGAVVLTLLLSGLVIADLTKAHSPVSVQTAGSAQGLADTGGDQNGTAAGGPTATAAPGAQGAVANRPGAAAPAGGTVRGGTGAGSSVPGAPTVACASCGVVGRTLVVGSIITLTGPGRSKQMADAVNAWVQDVNRRGGINGFTIKFDFRDDGGNADTGAAEYKDFAEGEHVFAVLGECAPITDEREVGYVNQQQLVLVGECQSSPDAYKSPYIWVTGPTPYQPIQLRRRLKRPPPRSATRPRSAATRTSVRRLLALSKRAKSSVVILKISKS